MSRLEHNYTAIIHGVIPAALPRVFKSTNKQGLGLLDGGVEHLYKGITGCSALILYKVNSRLTGAF